MNVRLQVPFQILWPESFFPHSCSIEGKSSCATHSTISGENRNYFSRTLSTAKIKSAKKKTIFFRQNRENLAT